MRCANYDEESSCKGVFWASKTNGGLSSQDKTLLLTYMDHFGVMMGARNYGMIMCNFSKISEPFGLRATCAKAT
jgi:hypothetical protein